jgi:hypothetical protein
MRTRLILAALLLFSANAQAAKRLAMNGPNYLQAFGVGSTFSVSYTGTAGRTSIWYPTGGGNTVLLRIFTTSAAHIRTGTSPEPTATASDFILPANTEMILEVPSGSKVSAVPVSTNGLLYTSEIITYPGSD